MITYIDTEEVRAILSQARLLEKDLREYINNLYLRLSNVPNDSKEWVGQKANYYFEHIAQDKIPLDSFCDSLEKLNYQIENAMNDAEAAIKG
jgi:hypothetical protein